MHKNSYSYVFFKIHFEIAIDVKTIIIGHDLNNKYDQLLSFLPQNSSLK